MLHENNVVHYNRATNELARSCYLVACGKMAHKLIACFTSGRRHCRGKLLRSCHKPADMYVSRSFSCGNPPRKERNQ